MTAGSVVIGLAAGALTVDVDGADCAAAGSTNATASTTVENAFLHDLMVSLHSENALVPRRAGACSEFGVDGATGRRDGYARKRLGGPRERGMGIAAPTMNRYTLG